MDLTAQLLQAFVTLFVIMDPFATIPVFHAMTKSQTPAKRFESAKVAVFTAAAVLVAFIFIGPALFGVLGIKMEHFKIAGGLVLFLIALQYVLGLSFPRDKKKVDVGIVIIGVPLITGPGVLTASILLVNSVGLFATLGIALACLVLSFGILLQAKRIMAVFGETGSEVFSRIMGLLLASLAIEFILSGLAALGVVTLA